MISEPRSNYIVPNSTPSKSTDKLKLLVEAVKHMPDVAFQNLKSVRIDWIEIEGEVVPDVVIEYK